jgi:hypothetical protein
VHVTWIYLHPSENIAAKEGDTGLDPSRRGAILLGIR